MILRDSPNTHTAGFTVLEALIAVGIVAILTAAGTPALQSWVLNSRMSAEVNGLVGGLHRARSEAIKRRAPVALCAAGADGECGSGGRWDRGWLLFVDADRSGDCDADETVLRVHQQLAAGFSTRATRTTALTFTADGRTPGSNTTFLFCDQRGLAAAKAVIVANTGRIRTAPGKSISGARCPGTT